MALRAFGFGRERAVAAAEERVGFFTPYLLPAVLGFLGVLAVFIFGRIYQGQFAISKGLDTSSPAFGHYWYSFLIVELTVYTIVGVSLWGWIWLTRDRHMELLTPREELKRYIGVLAWIMVMVVPVWMFGWLGEQDGSWHQTVIRDTHFTPSHILIFYMNLPLAIIIVGAGWLYAHTRIPQFSKGVSIAMLLVFAGLVLELANVGLNEWGHTFWQPEEIFSSPLHWGFVALVWLAGPAFFAVAAQLVPRIIELIREVRDVPVAATQLAPREGTGS